MSNIAPVGILTQYIFLCNEHSKPDAISLMTTCPKIESWLMAGHPMTVEKCVLKCERWKRRVDIQYSVSEDKMQIIIDLSYLTFRYNWTERKAYVNIKPNANRKENVFVLNGKQCCNIDRVFCLNERLENAVNFPKVIDWIEGNGILSAKEADFNYIYDSMKWWTNITHKYNYAYLKLYSNRKLRNYQTDDNITINTWSDGIGDINFTLKSGDYLPLEKRFADFFLSVYNKERQEAASYLAYLRRTDIEIPNYNKRTQPKDFKSYFYSINEKFRSTYNLLYITAKNLGMTDKYCGRFYHANIDTYNNRNQLHIYLHTRNQLHDTELRFDLNNPDLENQFPLFWQNFKQKACQLLEENIKYIDDSISQINKRIAGLKQ